MIENQKNLLEFILNYSINQKPNRIIPEFIVGFTRQYIIPLKIYSIPYFFIFLHSVVGCIPRTCAVFCLLYLFSSRADSI